MTKYGAKKTIMYGIKFDSKLEAGHYAYLVRKEKDKLISDIELQPTWQIVLNNKNICKVKLDFKFYDKERDLLRYIDSKGMDNANSRLKRKLVEAQEGIKVEVWTNKNWGLAWQK